MIWKIIYSYWKNIHSELQDWQISLLNLNNGVFFSLVILVGRPFAWSGHMVQKHTCWDASCTVGVPKQRNSHQSALALTLKAPLCNLCPSMCDFVSCDQIVQRAYYREPSVQLRSQGLSPGLGFPPRSWGKRPWKRGCLQFFVVDVVFFCRTLHARHAWGKVLDCEHNSQRENACLFRLNQERQTMSDSSRM